MKREFSEDGKKKLTQIIARYPRKDAALLPALWLAQEEFGYISADAKEYISNQLEVSIARIDSVISFYTLFKTKPSGTYVIQVCRTISCALRGCDGIMKAIEEELGIKPGESTSDGMFTYEHVECIAACGGAPALQVNGLFEENLKPETVKSLIRDLRNHGKDHH